jgi:chromosome partitioning protein
MGQGVTEFNPKGQAAKEIRQLWSWIEKRTQFTKEKQSKVFKDVKAA